MGRPSPTPGTSTVPFPLMLNFWAIAQRLKITDREIVVVGRNGGKRYKAWSRFMTSVLSWFVRSPTCKARCNTGRALLLWSGDATHPVASEEWRRYTSSLYECVLQLGRPPPRPKDKIRHSWRFGPHLLLAPDLRVGLIKAVRLQFADHLLRRHSSMIDMSVGSRLRRSAWSPVCL